MSEFIENLRSQNKITFELGKHSDFDNFFGCFTPEIEQFSTMCAKQGFWFQKEEIEKQISTRKGQFNRHESIDWCQKEFLKVQLFQSIKTRSLFKQSEKTRRPSNFLA